MKKRLFFCLLPLLLLLLPASAEIVITEVMASNGYFESGHAWDWVELYNPTSQDANLAGYGLSDDSEDPYKFTFPEGAVLKAGAR